MSEIKPVYNCTQDELYAAIILILKSYFEEQALFAGLKGKYTVDYGNELMVKVKAAQLMPSDSQRLGEQGLLREEMLKQLNLALDKVNRLRLYIRDAYTDKAVRELKLKIAGFDDYNEAANANWDKVRTLMVTAKEFITTNEADLMANNNMPATFKAGFDALEAEIQPQITEMLNYRENNKQATAEKLKMNNAIHAEVMALCEDGAFLLRDDDAKKSQFIFSSVLEIITPPGASSLTVKVTRVSDGTAVLNANVKINREGTPEREAMNTEDGAYFGNLSAGTYSVQVDIEGQVSFVSFKDVETGVNARLDVKIGV